MFFKDLGECSHFPFGLPRFVGLYLYYVFVFVFTFCIEMCSFICNDREPSIVYVYTCNECL